MAYFDFIQLIVDKMTAPNDCKQKDCKQNDCKRNDSCKMIKCLDQMPK